MLRFTPCIATVLLATLSAVAAEEACASLGDPACDPSDVSALSLLQTKATKIVQHDDPFDLGPDFLPTYDMMKEACKKQCAGTVCQDENVGSNQMLSCMQACAIRMAGEEEAACESKCDRNGGSGCSLTVNGFTAHMCASCGDWVSSSQAAKSSFLSNADCKKGCKVETPCEKQCAGTVCSNPKTGSNQMLSCAQTCVMRMHGQEPAACLGQCDRNGGSGCSLTVNGFTANMCASCGDWAASSQAAKTSFLHNDDCKKGCNVGKLTKEEKMTYVCQQHCAGTVCPDPKIGSNQMLSCMQSCEMAARGLDPVECGYKCKRDGQSGCSLTLNGFTANMCAYCSDWPTSSQAAKESFLSNDDCLRGCTVLEHVDMNETMPLQ